MTVNHHYNIIALEMTALTLPVPIHEIHFLFLMINGLTYFTGCGCDFAHASRQRHPSSFRTGKDSLRVGLLETASQRLSALRIQLLERSDEHSDDFLAIGVNRPVRLVIRNQIDIVQEFEPIERLSGLLERNRLLGDKIFLGLREFRLGQICPDGRAAPKDLLRHRRFALSPEK